MRQRLRITLTAFVLSAGVGAFSACGPEATDLSTCENVRVKKRLCNDQFPIEEDQVCGSGATETARCQAECWYEASCDDIADEIPREGVDDCLSDCGFRCADGREIPTSWECDGRIDCDDSSDEEDCGGVSMFECADGQAIPATWRCDQRLDCEDGSDESGC